MEPTEKLVAPRAARAKVACRVCRARKVRCDVVRKGLPCTNCSLDHRHCTLDLAGRG